MKISLTSFLFRLIAACLTPILVVHSAFAEPNFGDMKMNTRVFNLGVDPETLGRNSRFIPLNRAKWLGKLLDEDVLLQGLVIHIKVLPQPVTSLWQFPGPGLSYKFTDEIPDKYLLEGYDIASSKPDDHVFFFYLPKVGDRDFSASCAVNRQTMKELTFCSVSANYPPDPNIFIRARIYNPDRFDDLGMSLRLIAQQIREIAYCLDVTEEEFKDYSTSPSLEDLKGCQPDVIS